MRHVQVLSCRDKAEVAADTFRKGFAGGLPFAKAGLLLAFLADVCRDGLVGGLRELVLTICFEMYLWRLCRLGGKTKRTFLTSRLGDSRDSFSNVNDYSRVVDSMESCERRGWRGARLLRDDVT
jgi:hypothetical protein